MMSYTLGLFGKKVVSATKATDVWSIMALYPTYFEQCTSDSNTMSEHSFGYFLSSQCEQIRSNKSLCIYD